MKRQIRTYTFSPAGAGAGTITFTNFTTIRLDAILMVVNTTRQAIIFNLADPLLGGTVATNVLTLEVSTTGHNSGDSLYIVYDDDDLDYDSGAGTMHRQAMGLVVPGSGGPVAVPGDAANGLDVDVTRVSGTVTTTLSGTPAVTQTPATSGGLTIGPGSGAKLISAASTNATLVKNGPGQVYGWHITNTNASARFVKLYNKASSPTVGTDVPVMTLLIPGNTSGSGAVAAEFVSGIAFSTGIALALTTGSADADTGAVAASDIIVNLFFK